MRRSVGERLRVERADDADALERRRRAAGERQLVARVVEVAVEPGERGAALPGLSDQLVAISRIRPPVERLAARGRMEDRRVDGVRDHDRVAQLEPELAVLLEREPRLEDRRRGELGVDLARSARPCRRRSRGRRRSGRRRGAPCRAPRSANRRSRRKSKLNELKRQAGVPPEMRLSSTVEPAALELARRARGGTGARRPTGGGANSWKSARSACPRRVRRRSTSVPTRRVTASARPARRARDRPRLHDDHANAGLERRPPAGTYCGSGTEPSTWRGHDCVGERASSRST